MSTMFALVPLVRCTKTGGLEKTLFNKINYVDRMVYKNLFTIYTLEQHDVFLHKTEHGTLNSRSNLLDKKMHTMYNEYNSCHLQMCNQTAWAQTSRVALNHTTAAT